MLQSTLKAVKTLFSECCVVLSIFLLQRIRQCDVNEVNVFRNCFEGFGKINSSHLELRLCLHVFVFLVLRSAFVPGLPFQVRYIFPITNCIYMLHPSILPNPSNRPKESHGPYIHSLPFPCLLPTQPSQTNPPRGNQ